MRALPGTSPATLARRIEARTGLKARTAEDFKADTVRWFFINSEDVGDIASMISIAMLVGFGVTGVMLSCLHRESETVCRLKDYGSHLTAAADHDRCTGRLVRRLGNRPRPRSLCAGGQPSVEASYPFRMMWFTPVLGSAMVVLGEHCRRQPSALALY